MCFFVFLCVFFCFLLFNFVRPCCLEIIPCLSPCALRFPRHIKASLLHRESFPERQGGILEPQPETAGNFGPKQKIENSLRRVHILPGRTLPWGLAMFQSCLAPWSYRLTCVPHSYKVHPLEPQPQPNSGLCISWLHPDYILIKSWLYHDYILIISWLYPDYILITSWLYPDYSLIVTWLYLDYILIESWVYPYYTMTISWLYPDYILIISR